jgi:flagellar hook-basal body complex protein FliE
MMQFGIESIAAIAAAQPSAAPLGASSVESMQGTAAPGAFANVLQRELGDLNANLGAAEKAMSDLAAGKPVELHEVMISLERARIGVQTFVQIRNKLVESYQDLMRMQL